MTNIDSILKSRDITLPTKVCLVKAMVFPVVMYGCESWTIKKVKWSEVKSLSRVRLFATPWTVAHHAPRSMGFYFFIIYLFIYLFFSFTILHWFCHISTWIHHRYTTCSPSWTLLPPPSPYHPSGSSQCTSPKHPVSCIKPGLVTLFIYDIMHVSMPSSQIIPPSPSPIEPKRLFYTSVSLLLSRIQGYCYHLSKFLINALVYCIGIFLSGLLHSV